VTVTACGTWDFHGDGDSYRSLLGCDTV